MHQPPHATRLAWPERRPTSGKKLDDLGGRGDHKGRKVAITGGGGGGPTFVFSKKRRAVQAITDAEQFAELCRQVSC